MNPDFLAAVLDTLLPGDEALPSATRAALNPETYVDAHRDIFAAIVAQAGGPDLFIHADADIRSTLLREVERAGPDAFRALLTVVLTDYCESATLLAALGWRSQPPQPTGHRVPPLDEAAAVALQRVRQRGTLWRE